MLAALNYQITAACNGQDSGLHQRMLDCLTTAVSNPLLLSHIQRPADPNDYARHLLYEDPQKRFSVFSLIWNKGQITPVHAHHYWCAYAVVKGVMTENLYVYDAAVDKAKLTGTYQRPAGYACFHEPGLGVIHQLSNTGDEQAISLHVYGTTGVEPRRQMNREHTNFAQAKHINRLVEVE